jgi:hypothetical protein
LRKRGPIASLGAQCFIEENHAANRFLDPFGGKQHLAISAAVVFVRFDLDAVKASLDSSHALVGSQYPLAFRHHASSNGFQFLCVNHD